MPFFVAFNHVSHHKINLLRKRYNAFRIRIL